MTLKEPMLQLDKRFALIRDGQPWYPALISGRTSPTEPTFRISGNGKRDAFGQADRTTDLDTVARAVLSGGRRARFAPEGGRASSLYCTSRGVTSWRLDPMIAARIGLPATGTTT